MVDCPDFTVHALHGNTSTSTPSPNTVNDSQLQQNWRNVPLTWYADETTNGDIRLWITETERLFVEYRIPRNIWPQRAAVALRGLADLTISDRWSWEAMRESDGPSWTDFTKLLIDTFQPKINFIVSVVSSSLWPALTYT